MKYNVGYYGNNNMLKKELTDYSNYDNGEKINYIDISAMDDDLLEATAFNGLIFDTSIHGSEKDNNTLFNIIKSNPDIDIMPIISGESNENSETETEKEYKLIKEKTGISTIPYLASCEKECKLFMMTIFSTLSSKTIRNMEEIENYELGSRENILKVLKGSVITLEFKDPYTNDHSRRVSSYAKQIAIKMGLEEEEIKAIEDAGWLHDIGKSAIKDGVLMKTDKLTDHEYNYMRKHAEYGALLLKNAFAPGEFENVIDYTKHHHERYDGKGYPDKIAGENIPLGARILCLADCFDAMTTQRSYNKPKKMEDAILDLQQNSGTQFDPKVAETFISLLKQEPEKLKETLGISIDSDGYVQVSNGPKIDKELIKENEKAEKNPEI